MFCQVEGFMSQEFEFPWKSNVVLGFVWFEDFEKKKEGQWAQKRKIKVI
jgi:hypothetical protein